MRDSNNCENKLGNVRFQQADVNSDVIDHRRTRVMTLWSILNPDDQQALLDHVEEFVARRDRDLTTPLRRGSN